MKAIIYTAIFGGYDEPKKHSPQDMSCDFLLFTDKNLRQRIGDWRVIRVATDANMHPRMQAKYFKLMSHEIFPRGRLSLRYVWHHPELWLSRRYDVCIWLDGGLMIKSPRFVHDMVRALDGAEWALFNHPDRDCIYEEAEVSLTMRKYQSLPINQQVASYRESVPPHGGLYACGIIVRAEPSSSEMQRLNRAWWDENVKWTYQDQLSLPFIMSRFPSCRPAIIDGNLWRNDWFTHAPHAADL